MTEYAAAYARLSDEDALKDAESRGRSLERQFANERQRAQREGWEIFEEVADEDCTGTTMFRPGIARITQLAQQRRITIVLADESARLGRTVAGFDAWYNAVLVPNGVRVELCSGFYRTGNAQDWFGSTVQMAANEYYSRQLSDKQKNANAHKRARGMLIGGRPQGTLAGGPGQRHRVKNPATFPFVVEAFERRAAGEAFSSIAADFDRRRVPTVEGGQWLPATVRSMVGCRWYIGQTLHRGEVVLAPDGQPVYYEHDAMLPRELWERANAWSGKVYAKDEHVYLLCDPRRADRRSLVVCSAWEMLTPAGKAGTSAEFKGRHLPQGRCYRRIDQDGRYYSARPRDAAALKLAALAPAADFEAAVVERVMLAAERNEVLSGLAQHADDTARAHTLRRALLAGELREGRAVRGKLEAALALAAKQGAAHALLPLNREVDALDAQLARWEAELQQLALAPPRMADVAPRERFELLRECWRDGRRFELRDLLGEMLDEVDIRADGIHILFKGGCEIEKKSPRVLVLRSYLERKGRRYPVVLKKL